MLQIPTQVGRWNGERGMELWNYGIVETANGKWGMGLWDCGNVETANG